MRGLYAIIDADFVATVGVGVIPFAQSVASARPAALQLRAKHASARQTLAWLRELRPLCTAAGVLLFANDRPDLAVLAGCDGVHVGQDDLDVAHVRRFAPSLRVGVSTHDEAQLRGAIAARPDYVAFGPVYPTRSKDGASPVVGLSGLSHASDLCKSASLPLVAIGGIDVERAPEVAAFAQLGAVIRALWSEDGPLGVTARAFALHRALGAAS